MKKFKYYVIGGQYEPYCYGGSDSLRGAKCIATRNKEPWDNFGWWHIPSVYSAENVKITRAHGMITHVDNEETVLPDGEPCAYYDNYKRKWMQ